MPQSIRKGDRSLLRLEQVALRLGVSRSQVHRLIAAGELPTMLFGPRKRRVQLEDLETYMATHPVKAQPVWLRQLENAEARADANILILAATLPTALAEDFERLMQTNGNGVVLLDEDDKPLAWECGHLFGRHAARSTACVQCRCETWRELTTCPECGVPLNEVNAYCNVFPLVTFNHRLQSPQYLLGSDCYVRCDGSLKFFPLPEQG